MRKYGICRAAIALSMYRQFDARPPLIFKRKQSGMLALLGITFVINMKLIYQY